MNTIHDITTFINSTFNSGASFQEIADAELNIVGIKSLLLQVISLVTLVSAIGVLLRAHRRDQSGALMAIGVLLVGALIVGLAAGNNMELVGNWLVHLIFNI